MATNQVNWDNLRLFLSVARAQSAQEAARRLDLDHSTVTRRLHRLEKELGAQLFERTPAGHVLTTAGHRLLEHVEAIESSVVLAGEDVGGDSQMLTGQVRLGLMGDIGHQAGGVFVTVHGRHPGTGCERTRLELPM